MKKLVALSLFIVLISSCSPSSWLDTPNIRYDVLPVVEYEIPVKEFEYSKIYEITLKYFYPTTCHFFQDIYFTRNENTRTIGILSGVLIDKNDCIEKQSDTLVRKFNLQAMEEKEYVLKFYKGIDKDGEYIYDVVTIPVVKGNGKEINQTEDNTLN